MRIKHTIDMHRLPDPEELSLGHRNICSALVDYSATAPNVLSTSNLK